MTMNFSRSFLFLFCFVFFIPGAEAGFAASGQEESQAWAFIKNKLFGEEREILEDNVIGLVTPARAENAAIVPLRIQANFEQTDKLFIKKIYLVVDNNPSPVVGTFTLSRKIDLANLSTRIRVNSYSFVRAIAETSDGQLHMTANFVKASGGCSAPAAGDAQEAEKRRGQMKLRQKRNREVVDLQFMINHPNNSGLQIDQLTRLWIPADYVTTIKLGFNNEDILSFKGGISMSENPTIRFNFIPRENGILKADVQDSRGRSFSQSWDVKTD